MAEKDPKKEESKENEKDTKKELTAQEIKDIEAKAKAVVRDQYIKELDSLKDQLKQFKEQSKKKEEDKKEEEDKLSKLEKSYQEKIDALKQESVSNKLETILTKKSLEAGLVVPKEFLGDVKPDMTEAEITQIVESAIKKTQELIEKNKGKGAPASGFGNTSTPTTPDLDSYSSPEDLKKDLSKFFNK